MKSRKQLERRTFLQDRYDILYKKLKKGEASFAELTELDFIVNHSSMIRNKVLEEMQSIDESPDDEIMQKTSIEVNNPPQNLLEKIKSFFGRVFTLKLSSQQSAQYFRNACVMI